MLPDCDVVSPWNCWVPVLLRLGFRGLLEPAQVRSLIDDEAGAAPG